MVNDPAASRGSQSAPVMLDRNRPKVSILIKALNEEECIAAAIESALASLPRCTPLR